MNIKKQENQFAVEQDGKTYIVPFISNVILDGEKTYYSTEITWDKEVAQSTKELIVELAAQKQKKK